MAAGSPSPWVRALQGLSVGACIAYPALVWFGLTRWGPRTLALALLTVLVPVVLLRRRVAPATSAGLGALPLFTVGALLLAATLDQGGFVLLVPVAVNAVLLVAFGVTLRRGAVPMIERFARLQVSDLSSDQQAWCRAWTRIWIGFFVFNGTTALALALAAPLSWWATYNGLVAYILMGSLFATEWLLRRRRFPGGAGS